MNGGYEKKITILEQEIKKFITCSFDEFKLVIVTKSQDENRILEIINHGYKVFGENYIDEAIRKIEFFRKYRLEWHFIGKIQSNKIKKLCKYFDWVQTICSEKHAMLLNEECLKNHKYMNACIQVNLDKEPSKSGIDISDLSEFLTQMDKFKNILIRGLMAIPKKSNVLKERSDSYNILRLAFEKHKEQREGFDTLSLGMSNDYIDALKNGSTMLRVGQYIFGEREKNEK